MATRTDVAAQCRALMDEARAGIFKPVYLLMGDEPYYPELVCKCIIDTCVEESAKDFNETVVYGADVTADQIITSARQYPMMSDRVLVVVKDAQNVKNLEQVSVYLDSPLDSTVLVLLMRGSAADKRRSLFKTAQKIGAVVDSPAVRDYEIERWISAYCSSIGLSMEPGAAALLGESVGTDLSTIVAEIVKLRRNLPEGATSVSAADIERNVGISRQFSVFELTRELSARNSEKALRIASHLGNSAKFALPPTIGALYTHFNRILRYEALLARGVAPSKEDKERALAGVNPYFYREYDTAMRNYPLQSTSRIVSLLCDYDALGKGGAGGAVSPGDLLVELVARILSA